MKASDDIKPTVRPDCPREYHDDYAGYRPTRSASLLIGVCLAGVAACAGAVWLVTGLLSG